MLLTLTSTAPDPAGLSYLLHKHPDRVQSFSLSVGTAHVCYPEVSAQRCTALLLLEVDPIALVRNKRFGGEPSSLAQYVNDRPYAASSFLAVAIAQVFGSALNGRCAARPELVDQPLDLAVRIPAVPGPDLIEPLFAPLGWQIELTRVPLDPEIPRWGEARYVDLTLTGSHRLADALNHLYVLLPVLDGAKHYWVGDAEIDKLLRRGSGWLAEHPQRELIAHRYLARQRDLVADATARLVELDDQPTSEPTEPSPATRPLAKVRRDAVVATLLQLGARRVVDLGCGEGHLLAALLADPSFTEVVGVDVSARELDRAERRLALDRRSDAVRARLTLRQGSAVYRDPELAGYDAVVLMEVVEHLEPDRLPDLARIVFGNAHPAAVVVTTPNADYNPRFGLTGHRHPDHRFEWTRAEFAAWCVDVADKYDYQVEQAGIGEPDPVLGSPTQLAVFTATSAEARP